MTPHPLNVPALFEKQDPLARLAELPGDRSSSWTGADHDHVRFLLDGAHFELLSAHAELVCSIVNALVSWLLPRCRGCESTRHGREHVEKIELLEQAIA